MSPVDGDDPLRAVAFAARDGDSAALEQLVVAVQDQVYRLALRMLGDPDDAQDATQSALVRIVTRVGTYRGDAAFRTWAYRVAANHILNFRQSRVERENLDFRRFAEDLHDGLIDANVDDPDAGLLVEEVKLGCTLAMLSCLDRDDRLAYILSDVFDLRSDEAAYVCETTPTAFRKRASRARARLRDFVGDYCGLVNPDAACRCARRVAMAVRSGRVNPALPRFATSAGIAVAVAEMDRLHDLASLMRSHPQYRTPKDVADGVQRLIASGRYSVLE